MTLLSKHPSRLSAGRALPRIPRMGGSNIVERIQLAVDWLWNDELGLEALVLHAATAMGTLDCNLRRPNNRMLRSDWAPCHLYFLF